MERIQAAIQKAKEQRGDAVLPSAQGHTPGHTGAVAQARQTRNGYAAPAGPAWAEIAAFAPDARLMARNRVVTFADADPVHVTFDMMRTKLLRLLRQNGWTSLGITSPTADCGKTTTSLNIAFSLAHQPEVRTVLLDLDLRRPAIAKLIGLAAPQSMASVLQGTRPVAENFVRYGENLAIGTNAGGMRSSSELPHLDCVLLVAAAERSRLDEVDKCEHDLAEQTRVLGVVLNKCRYGGEDYGYY
jgi:protein-tyrosine kinase